ncbi:glycosyltransferase family 4 protein [Luteitalea sp. TBR-22]|uniref:glycosyltransferase family 4 protein n=1 Tax=Luteitalea sp. TBR-22 TaxID=2802971 RepID=UPI001EF70E86|nr:glycosyltransferase family 4 protein [Luteitalea sp. TBR-22]
MVVYTNYDNDARVRREAETLAANGFRVVCFSNRTSDRPRRYMLDGVDVRELDVPKYRGKSGAAYLASYGRFLLKASVACVQLSREARVDVVHCHNLPDILSFAGLVPRLRGSRVVLDIHDSIPETFASKFANGALRWKLLCLEERLGTLIADRVICVNHPQRDALITRGLPAGKTFVSMNVPDPRIFVPTQGSVAARPDGAFNLVYHGTMASRLGVDLVLRAVHALAERLPRLRLHLWGGGDDLPAFQALASQLGVADRIHFRPQGYPLEELPDRLASMDVGVVGNRRSPAGELMLPVKLLEYAALGIPAVVPRLRTISHYFSDEMVMYYEPGDVASMAEAIERLLGDQIRRREQPRKAAEFLNQHGWHQQGPELVDFYRSLVSSEAVTRTEALYK